MAKDNIKCAFTNAEISLRIFLAIMVTNCSAKRSFSQLKHRNSEKNNNDTGRVGFLISADVLGRIVAQN